MLAFLHDLMTLWKPVLIGLLAGIGAVWAIVTVFAWVSDTVLRSGMHK